MRNIMLLNTVCDVADINLQLRLNPWLWNRRTGRTESPESPHHGLDDIWVRGPADGGCAGLPHESVWYPESEALPAVKEIAYEVMHHVKAENLGGILITRIPPGETCKPHIDNAWHAKTYNCKVAMQLESAPGQAFCFVGERLSAMPGQCYWFNNLAEHWVENQSDFDRVTLIITMKKEGLCQPE